MLDTAFIRVLGQFDIVCSWGALHHTDEMWTAIENAASLVGENGLLYIALYNDQGIRSQFWRRVKRFYCSGILGKAVTSSIFLPFFFGHAVLVSVIKHENRFTSDKRERGMSITHN